MKKYYLFLGALVCWSLTIYSQVVKKMEKTYAGISGGSTEEIARSVIQTTDRGYALLGTTTETSSGRTDMYLVKVERDGDTSWTKKYGYYDAALSQEHSNPASQVIQTADGGYLLVGSTQFNNRNDIYIVKTNATGDTTWTRLLGDGGVVFPAFDFTPNEGVGVVVTADNGYLVVANTQSFGTNAGVAYNIYLTKLDLNGNLATGTWPKVFGGTEDETASRITATPDGGYLIAGELAPATFPGPRKAYLLKVNATGDSLWSKTYAAFPGLGDSEGDSRFDDIAVLPSGDYAFIGSANVVNGALGIPTVLLVRTDSNGTKKKLDTIMVNCPSAASSCTQNGSAFLYDNRDKSYIVTGLVEDDIYVRKVDTNANIKWSRAYGQSGPFESGYAILRNDSGCYIIAGNRDASGSSDFYLLELCDTTVTTGMKSFLGKKDFNIRFYPNPFKESVAISVQAPVHELQLGIYNLLGNLVHQQQVTNRSTSLHLSLPAGVYIYKLSSAGQAIQTGKLVVE